MINNGGGIETTHIYDDARVYFDIDNDGFAEHFGWIKPTDGILALDRNGNGSIDNITAQIADVHFMNDTPTPGSWARRAK